MSADDTNEDSYCARADLGLFAVADGVGGHAAGEVASQPRSTRSSRPSPRRAAGPQPTPGPSSSSPPLGVDGNRLNWALHLANLRLRTEMQAAPGRSGMATTVAIALLEGDARGPSSPMRSATVAHVGDSRIYRWRRGQVDRLTRDHSWVQEQVSAGLIDEHEARRHPRRNLLTRALSGTVDPVADIGWVPLASGRSPAALHRRPLGVLTDEEIARIAGEEFDGGGRRQRLRRPGAGREPGRRAGQRDGYSQYGSRLQASGSGEAGGFGSSTRPGSRPNSLKPETFGRSRARSQKPEAFRDSTACSTTCNPCSATVR